MGKKPPPPAGMMNLTIGHWVARLIHAAAKLRLADLLKDSPRTADELATAAGVQAPALYRVLRALASAAADIKLERYQNWRGPEQLVNNVVRLYAEFNSTLVPDILQDANTRAAQEYNAIKAGRA